MSRRDELNHLLEVIGLRRNTVQVLEGEETINLMYPNYFTSIDVESEDSEHQIYMDIRQIVREHLDAVQDDMILIDRFGKEMGYV